MRFIFSLLLVSLLCVSCNRPFLKIDENPLVRVGGNVLYVSDVDANTLLGLSPGDSVIAAEHYIRTWINDQLLFDVASQNISNKEEIEKMVANYRRSLIIYQYQEQLINEKLDKEITEDMLFRYYEANRDRFILERPLVKGVFLKIPRSAPQIQSAIGWCKKITADKEIDSDNIERIEKYCIQSSAVYEFFVDNWIDFNELVGNWPVNYRNEKEVLKVNRYIEQQDSSFYYFLNITDYLLAGDRTPFEYAQPVVREILLNQKKMEFLTKTETDLYDRALNRGQIIFYNE